MAFLEAFSLGRVVLLLAVFWACWTLSLAIYRIYLSPLAKFPGPKLSAATYWYEFYHDCIRHGRFSWEIERMHDVYGPIVRINPDELHIRDADWHDEIYTSSTRPRNKCYFFVGRIGRGSIFGSISDEQHRLRRQALNPFFSKKSIVNIEPQIQEKVDKFCSRLLEHSGSKEPLNLGACYTALTLDVISDYAYGQPLGLLDLSDFGSKWREMIKMSLECMAPVRSFPWLMDVLENMPYGLALRLNASVALMLEFQHQIRAQIIKTLERGTNSAAANKTGQKTIFETLRDSTLPPAEKKIDRLKEEGFVLTAAAADATSMTLTVLTYHLLSSSSLLSTLLTELQTAQSDPTLPIPWQTLEQLPFFRACITEGLRISALSTSRLIRSAPYEILRYKEWEIPEDTFVSMTSHFIHMSPEYYTDPFKFDPERWLRADADGTRHQLDKYFVPFSRGSRACIGQNLALAELYLGIASVVRRVPMQLFETTRDDVKVVRDAFVGNPIEGSNGVRVVVGGGGEGDVEKEVLGNHASQDT
ncbi:MAG: hypothetical protein MMC33_002877 [Icmadophila ericetorum]|nr:hypothetical protein [Icmadophila ericetorum]